MTRLNHHYKNYLYIKKQEYIIKVKKKKVYTRHFGLIYIPQPKKREKKEQKDFSSSSKY